MQGSKDFLLRFRPEHRGAIGNWFFEAVRAGSTDPRAVCSAVYRHLRAGLEQYEDRPGKGVQRREVLRQMTADQTGALALAEYALWYEAQPLAERQASRQESDTEGRRQWMESQAPTAKQIETLGRLGHDGPIENRLHASELIDQLKDW